MAVGWAIGALAGGDFDTHGELRESRAWSTMKVPVIVASNTSGNPNWHAIDAARARARPARVELVRQDRVVARVRRDLLPGARARRAGRRGRDRAHPRRDGPRRARTVIALAAVAPDFEAAKQLASKHVPQ